jgi:Ca-activated chloride channel family protein
MRGFQLADFANPWMLVLLVPVAMLLLLEIFSRPYGSLSISTGETLRRIGSSSRLRLRHVPPVLRALGLALLVIALARPLQGFVPRVDRENVIDIMLCVDVSGSMKSVDFVVEGRRRDRLFVTKEAVHEFVEGRKDREGDRYGLDRLGLILYAGYAWTQCPLTLDYEVLLHELAQAEVDEQDVRKSGTAIGSSIGLAVSRLRKSEARSKVIVLLTDGLNNRGALDPVTAAQLAKEYDIRVYTIGAGTEEGGYAPAQGLFFGQTVGQRTEGIDEETLLKIAETTGGRYFRATDTESLEKAYDEISQLETTEIEIGEYYDYKEGFTPYAVLGGLALLAALISRRAWFEPIP